MKILRHLWYVALCVESIFIDDLGQLDRRAKKSNNYHLFAGVGSLKIVISTGFQLS